MKQKIISRLEDYKAEVSKSLETHIRQNSSYYAHHISNKRADCLEFANECIALLETLENAIKLFEHEENGSGNTPGAA